MVFDMIVCRGGGKVCVPNYEPAKKDYMAGMKYKDIAAKYGVSLATVKSWKTRYQWDRKGMRTKSKKVCVKQTVAKEVEQVCANPGLTDKQRLFCLFYVRCFNATKAYQKAYGVGYETAASIGYRMLENDGVRKEILRLKQNRLNREMLDELDIFQKYIDIAFADIKDFADIGGGMIHVKEDLDGTLISEISDTANGIKIKLADRAGALRWLGDHMDLATEEQRARIDKLRAEAARAKEMDVDRDEVGVVMIPEVMQDA